MAVTASSTARRAAAPGWGRSSRSPRTDRSSVACTSFMVVIPPTRRSWPTHTASCTGRPKWAATTALEASSSSTPMGAGIPSSTASRGLQTAATRMRGLQTAATASCMGRRATVGSPATAASSRSRRTAPASLQSTPSAWTRMAASRKRRSRSERMGCFTEPRSRAAQATRARPSPLIPMGRASRHSHRFRRPAMKEAAQAPA